MATVATRQGPVHGLTPAQRAMTRLAAGVVWLAFGFAMTLAVDRTDLREPPVIGAERLAATIERDRRPDPPAPAPRADSLPPKDQPKAAAPVREATATAPNPPGPRAKAEAAAMPRAASDPSLNSAVPSAPSRTAASTGAAGRQAPAIASATAEDGKPGGGQAPALNASARAVLRAQACLALDPRDRPPDCPPNSAIREMIQKEQATRYRPEKAEAFSRNEQQWRGVPPPCLPDGVNGKLNGMGACVRIGVPPSRVRDWKEICEARGLGNCTRPDQAAVDAAVKQTKGE